jgi:hypothetical protein
MQVKSVTATSENMIDKKLLKSALSTIHEDNIGRPFCSGLLDRLLVDLNVHFIQEKDKYRNIFFLFEYVHKDVWNLATIVQRQVFQRELASIGVLSNDVAAMFTACDIDLFHVQYRSLFDRLAKVVGLLSGRPHVVPESFRKLREWVSKPENETRIDRTLAQFITSCYWFSDLREIRDSIVHRNGRTVVSLKEKRILFQIHGLKNNVSLPKIMFSESLVDFELYSALFIGYLFAYMESIATISRQKLNLREYKVEPRNYHGGLRFIRPAIQQIYEHPDAV